MKRTTLFLTTLSLLAMPLFASAETAVSATTTVAGAIGTATPAQLMTQCAQSAIDIRDSAIGSARTAYNNAMAVALDARKDAEKKAVALDDNLKKDAIENAVEAYKTAVQQAQDTLTSARKDAWNQFESNTSACRDLSNQVKKGTSTPMRASLKADISDKGDNKSFKDTLLGQFNILKSLLKIGDNK